MRCSNLRERRAGEQQAGRTLASASSRCLGYGDRLVGCDRVVAQRGQRVQAARVAGVRPTSSSQLGRSRRAARCRSVVRWRRRRAGTTRSARPPSERVARGKRLEAALSGEQCLLVPRIPGVDEYLAALDEAVEDAVRRQSVAAATRCKQAAEQWEQITDAHGRDAQRQAYLKHLGISEPISALHGTARLPEPLVKPGFYR